MNKKYVIEVHNVKKTFKIFADKGSTAKEKVLFWKRNKYEEKKVLDDISFCVAAGESIGLIGHNGCGKSTTLKLLTRIMYPDSGSVVIRGRVSSLLELGAGFHPDMTGIENIYINASIFGLTKKEIDYKINEIIQFAELGEYINNPVRTYSSGMYMRLAFAVAINVNADILLIDEILAVGDVNFQAKCINRLFELKKQGVTIVLVSHSTEQIEMICDRSIWIDSGRIKLDGRTREVHKEYLKFMGEQRKKTQESLQLPAEEHKKEEKKENTDDLDDKKITKKKLKNYGSDVEFKERERGNGTAKITFIDSYDEMGRTCHVFESGASVTFKIRYKLQEKANFTEDNLWFGFCIFRNDGFRCYGTNTKIDQLKIEHLHSTGTFEITFPSLELLQGKYYVDVCIASKDDEMLDYLYTVNDFEVFNTTGEIGLMKMQYNWEIED